MNYNILKRNRYLAKNWDYYSNDFKESQEDKKSKQNSIGAAVSFLAEKGFARSCIFKIVKKYAQKYNATLTVPMVNYFVNLNSSERINIDSKISEEWEENKEFISKDIAFLKKANLSEEEIQIFIRKIMDRKVFSEEEILDFSSIDFIKNI